MELTELGVVNAQALLANPLIMAVCGFVLVLVWRGVRAGVPWALPTLVALLIPVQLFGLVSDSALGNHNAVANIVSSVVLLLGLALCRRP